MATHYAAFLRGISPMNAKMSELKQCFEAAGFGDVKTVLGSGNVVFSARSQAQRSLEQKAERAMIKALGKSFLTLVRSNEELAELLESDPFQTFKLSAASKRIVTFLHEVPKSKPKLPISLDGARILAVEGRSVLSAYVPSAKGPVFMNLIEKTFGQEVTTRTWDTVRKVVRAGTP